MKIKKYKFQRKHEDNFKPSEIPREYLERICYSGKHIESCIYYITADCPNECNFSRRFASGIKHTTRTGLERFENKYGASWRDIAYCNYVRQI